MKTRNTRKAFIALGGLLHLAPSANSEFADGAKCAGLISAPFMIDDAGVKIESATLVSATAQAPEHCDVRGAIWPEARFAAGRTGLLIAAENLFLSDVAPKAGFQVFRWMADERRHDGERNAICCRQYGQSTPS